MIAMIAAYAIALQALLSGGAIVAHAAAALQASTICATNGGANDAGGEPIGHQTDCPCGPACTMAACDAPMGLADAGGITIIWAALRGTRLELNIWSQVAQTQAIGRSNQPRAPPLS